MAVVNALDSDDGIANSADSAGNVEGRRIVGSGTSAQDWANWLARYPIPVIEAHELVHKGTALWIVAPHPDDEIVGCGGLLNLRSSQGMLSNVIAVTDGGASHPGSTLWPVGRLTASRARETDMALAVSAPDVQVHRLTLPDGALSQHEAGIVEALVRRVRSADTVLTTWRYDGHPDHEATGRACAFVCQQVGARLIEMPIWAWHWAEPGDTRWPWRRAVALNLPAPSQEAKRRAVRCFASQLEPDPSTGAGPILPEWALTRLLRSQEVFFL